MRRQLKNDILLLPVWKVDLYDGLFFYVLGKTSKDARKNIVLNDAIIDQDIKIINSVSIEEAKKILIDSGGELNDLETLYDEAIWTQHTPAMHFIVATCFDIIADLNLIRR
jgi:hypothetical protein